MLTQVLDPICAQERPTCLVPARTWSIRRAVAVQVHRLDAAHRANLSSDPSGTRSIIAAPGALRYSRSTETEVPGRTRPAASLIEAGRLAVGLLPKAER